MDYFDLLFGFIKNDAFWVEKTCYSSPGNRLQGAYFTHFLDFHR